MGSHSSIELFARLNERVKRYPPGVVPVPAQIQGTSFFPGGTGLWCEGSIGALPDLPVGGVMILGHDFHNEAGYRWSKKKQKENLRTATWRHLLDLLAQLPLSPTQCFFTNAYMGLRKGRETTGKFPGASDPAFVDACRQFFLVQLAAQRPRVILALGAHVPSFLAPLASQLGMWASTDSFRERDAANASLIEGVMFDGHDEPVVVVSLVHPSFRRLSLQHRTWGDLKADDAEIAMVRAALDLAGLERSGAPAPRVADARATPDAIVSSAITAVEGILPLPILPKHKRELISAMIWKITEAEGKYATRYCSAGARDSGKGIRVHHEHVFTRADLIDQILARPSDARSILDTAIGCVVTTEEHQALTRATRADPSLKGWARYAKAGVQVWDNRDKAWLGLAQYSSAGASR